MTPLSHDQIRHNVRGRYRQIALQESQGSTCCQSPACCDQGKDANLVSEQLGYSQDDFSSVPVGANLGLGCGNPQAIAEIKLGETVLDLGSGGGFDCFLASRQVGVEGKVIGVDMTPEMISRARSNATKGHFINTEFRLGEIEQLPVADQTVDAIISNCVVNLSPDKQQVFLEAFRVLRPGGRLAIADVVVTAELPPAIRDDIDALYSGCISGASSIQELERLLKKSGFTAISIEPKDSSKSFIKEWLPGSDLDQFLVSAVIKAIKPTL
ncbi:arsenite methyltransferase [Gorillibacterium timonense]|uniref:arsenite methyltransferase n=1 Tax=Gorillibacterium timonense TaxID=1689269 RepID=UPI00071D8619|nr:arsenite methyltransferase [Gorillibacterium timonense]